MTAVERHWDELPRREQQILIMRFWGNSSQEQVAARLGISQMHVSRLQARALAWLRVRLNGQTPHDAYPGR
jgi:RNA polymerase sigma-B factor